MEIDQLTATIRHLYEGQHQPAGTPLAAMVSFHDPMVIVRGQTRVVRMFRRLNRLFPASRVESFTSVDDSTHQFDLCVLYRRKRGAKGRLFRTRIELTVDQGEILKIVEHWQSPVRLNGNRTHGISRLLRRGLGHILA